MFGRNKGQKLSNFDDDYESVSLASGSSPMNSSPLGQPTSPPSSPLGLPVNKQAFLAQRGDVTSGKTIQQLAVNMGSISGEGTLGIAAHLGHDSGPSCQDSPKNAKVLMSQTTGEMGEIPTNLSPPGQTHAFPNHNKFNTLGDSDLDPIVAARVENIFKMKKQCQPVEEKTRRLHDHVSELQKSIQKVCDDFHRISNDISDLMPPSLEADKNISHKAAAMHEDVHNMVGVAIPSKIMPRFEQSLLGDLDLMMLHYLQEQVKFRKFHQDQINFERKDEEGEMKLGKKVDAATEASIILKQEKLARALKTSSEISEKGLSNLMEKEADMLDAWFYKFMQFQVHFFSEVGQQIMTLQGPSTRLADQLKKRNLDPSESAKILGDVAPETVVANPGWGTEHEEARLKGWFGIKGNKSPSTEEKNKWMRGMFRRRNVDFFKGGGGEGGQGGGGFFDDDDEDDSTSTPNSRRNSANNVTSQSDSNSRRGSKEQGASNIFKPNDLMGGLKKMFNKRNSNEFGSQKGLLGGGLSAPDAASSARKGSFPRPPESGAFPRTNEAAGTGKQMEGISSNQSLASKKNGGFFSAFQSKEGHSKSEEWVDFSAPGGQISSRDSDDLNVEFDSQHV